MIAAVVASLLLWSILLGGVLVSPWLALALAFTFALFVFLEWKGCPDE